MTTTKKTTATAKSRSKTTATKKPATLKTQVADGPIPDLPANPFIFEILNLANKQRSVAKKVEVLKKYEDPSLKTVLIWNFDESVESLLPPGEVPYTPNEAPAGTEHTLLEQESRRFYYFISAGRTNIPQMKRPNSIHCTEKN